MKKSFLLFLHVLGIFVSAYAQMGDISDGYYRMTNAHSDRYIHMLDNKGSLNIQTSAVDMGAIMLKKGIEKAISDPASVLYVEKHGSQYDIKAQDTGIHSMLEEDVDIYVDLIKSPQVSDAVWAYFKKGAMTMYLWDAKSNMDAEESYIDSRGSSRDWYIKPIDNSTDNYFGVKPTHQAGGKYYASMYAAFPFSLESPGMKAYYITLVDENKGVAVYKEISGTIPALTPVIIECSSDNPANNKLNIGGSGTVPSGNLGKGVLFDMHKYNHDNFVTYDKNTMRTIGLAPNGSLAMTAGEYQDVPKNTFYITVSESCPSSLKLIPESEYQPGSEETSIPAAPAEATVSRTDKEGEVEISWTPVTVDDGGNLLSDEDVTYAIVDKNSEIVAEGLRGTSYTYQAVSSGEQAFVYYGVYAATDAGTSASSAVTDMIVVGTPFGLPYVDSFDNGELSYTMGAYGGSGDWYFTHNTAYDADGTNGYVYYTNEFAGDSSSLATGLIDLNSASPVLTFAYYAISEDDDNIIDVYVDPVNGGESNLLESIPQKGDGRWIYKTISLAEYSSQTVQIRFAVTVKKYKETYIDNIRIQQRNFLPAAPAETTIARTDKDGEVVISWAPVTTVNNHRILYSQDFESVTDPASAGWTCRGGELSISTDDKGKMLLFSLGKNNGRSATGKWGSEIYTNFDGSSALVDGSYILEFEFCPQQGSDNQYNSAISVFSNEMSQLSLPEDVSKSLFDLRQIYSEVNTTTEIQFICNGDSANTKVFPCGVWYGVKLNVDVDGRKVIYNVFNKANYESLFAGEYKIPDNADISMYAEGIYVYLARYNTILQFDNIKVSSGNSTGIQLDADDVTYTIVDENSDIVAKGLKGTSYTFQAVPTGEQAFVYYGVYAVTEAGLSDGCAFTDMIAAGTPYGQYLESFDDGTLSYPMAYRGGSGKWYLGTDHTFNDVNDVDGTNGYLYYNSEYTGDSSSITTGLINLSTKSPALTFAYYAISEDDDNIIDVYVDPADGSESILLESIPQNGSGSWIYKTVNLAAYSGQTVQIRFVVRVKRKVNTFIDDIRIQQIESNLPIAPAEATVERTDNEGEVLISWEPVIEDVKGNPLGTEDVMYTIVDYDSNIIAEGLTGISHTFRAVPPGEQDFVQYAVFAVTDAGVSEGGALTEMIAVGTPYELPYAESFDGDNPDYPFAITGEEGLWYHVDESYFSEFTNPDSTNGIIAYDGEGMQNASTFMTGFIRLNAENPYLTFAYYGLADNDYNAIDVYVVSNNGFETSLLGTVAQTGIGWMHKTISLADYIEQTVQLRFQVTSKNYQYTIMDDIRIQNMTNPAPEISFAEGMVTIKCANADAKIHYTVDGTDPTIESELYKEPFALNHNATVKARAFLPDLDIAPSDIASLTVDSYKVATPTGDFDAEKRLLTLSCTTEGASIRYTLDLDGQWESYEGSIRIRRNCTVYAKATHEGYNDSEIADFSITELPETVPLPEITFNNGMVTITCILADAEIHYTVDGADPTIESELYKEPFALNNNATVKARAFLPDLDIEPSDIASLTVDSYKTATPELSYDSASGELTITCETQGATISYTFDLDGKWFEYIEPVKIERDGTVYARASFSGYNDSEIAKLEISVLKCMPVNISYDGRNVTLQTSDTNAAIKYTVDGSDPKNGLPYESSFDVMGLCQVKAIAVNDGYMDSDIAEYEVRGYADENHAVTSAGGLLQSCYGWNRDTIPSSTLRVEGWLNDDDYKFIRSMRGLRHLDIEKVVDAHIPDKAFADTRIVSISMPATITQHGAGILSGTPYLCAVIWNSTGRLGTWLTADISNPNMLLYVHSGITVDDKWEFNVVEDGKASSVTLHHGYPFYAPRDFHADYVSLTREFKLETVVGKCGGWETIVLPFAPDVITHETSGSITPFAAWDGDVNGNMRPFWLKSSVADGWENATKIEPCKPYIISMPNSPDYVESFNLAGKVTFSASSTSEKEIYLGPAASEPIATDWRDGTKLEGTFMPVEEVGLLAMNLHSDDNEHLPGSLFVDNETAVPFEAYVRNASTRRAMPVFGDQSGLGIPLKADVGITVDSPAPGTIRIHTTHERRVDIFTVTGLVVGSLRMEADETATMNDLLSGFYICGGVKVFVR